MEIANNIEPVQEGCIHIEKINRPFLFELKGTPARPPARLFLLRNCDAAPTGSAASKGLCC
jgi:hypothetical protein